MDTYVPVLLNAAGGEAEDIFLINTDMPACMAVIASPVNNTENSTFTSTGANSDSSHININSGVQCSAYF